MFKAFLKTLTLIILSAPIIVHAITNIEDARVAPPKNGWSGLLEISADGSNGNTNKEEYGAAAKLTYKEGNETGLMILSKSYGKTEDIKNEDNQFYHLRWMHLLSASVSSELFAQFQDDEFTRLTSRVLLGGGARAQLVAIPDRQLVTAGLGAFRIKEKYDLQTYEDEDLYWRYNTYLNFKQKLNGNVSFASTVYYQPRTDDHTDYRILLDASIITKMTEALALKIKYSLRHDSEPAENPNADPAILLDKTDTDYSVSLNYSF